ncbi:MAG: hypothetical protein M0Z36_08585 [Thermaerobacter sp.]|nr:hypothetical protein [Thermaerobacter sp.]
MKIGGGFAIIVLVSSLVAGCGATNSSSGTTSPITSSSASSPPASESIVQVPLIQRLSVNLNDGQLTAKVTRAHENPLTSKPIVLKSALQSPTSHWGILNGPTWTLVFGAAHQGVSGILVNGHPATQHPTPPTMKPGYILWEYFLPGHVNRPVVKLANHS